MTSDYLYQNYENILFDNSTNPLDNEDYTWKLKYPQYLIQVLDDRLLSSNETDEVEAFATKVNINRTKTFLEKKKVFRRDWPQELSNWSQKPHGSGSYMHMSDVLTTYFGVNLTQFNQKHNRPHFPFEMRHLDPIQLHFLETANHFALESFLSKLNDKQRKFLDFLLFCFAHHGSDEGYCDYYDYGAAEPVSDLSYGKSSNTKIFPSFIDENVIFGNIEWNEISGWTILTASEPKADALQIQVRNS